MKSLQSTLSFIKSQHFLFIFWVIITLTLFTTYIFKVHKIRQTKKINLKINKNIEILKKTITNSDIILSQNTTRHSLDESMKKHNITHLIDTPSTRIIVIHNE